MRTAAILREIVRPPDIGVLDGSEFPQLEFSKKDVIRAGDALRGSLEWTPEREAEIRKVFASPIAGVRHMRFQCTECGPSCMVE